MNEERTVKPNYHDFVPDSKEPSHCSLCWQYEVWWLHHRAEDVWITQKAQEEDGSIVAARASCPTCGGTCCAGDGPCPECVR